MDLQPCLDHIQWAHKGGSNSTYNAKTQITHYYTTQPNVIKMLKLEPNFETLNELKLRERDWD